ncbi:MAG: 4-hydroxy-tetrahydrodipicolinate reductase [Vicinamibacteria bacterium]|nr:4-hydroxy-tetrahydrodipicolinate reductase [Vicinamibacteria bacterium]
MKIAVVGYGKMGREVEDALRDRGHEAVSIDIGDEYPECCAVGIDFTQADAVLGNIEKAMRGGSRYVVGTTGWSDRLEEARRIVAEAGGGLVHSANFSIGVNLYFRIIRRSAEIMARFDEYDPYVIERHHRQKKDAPSGTAKVLARILEEEGGRRRRALSAFEGAMPDDAFHVASLRAGGIVGDHVVGWDSGTDEILIEHHARSRRGFALGAVMAAEWIATRSGFHTFEAVLDDLSSRE